MRYLLSSAFLNGTSYRAKIKEFVSSDIRLLAPESGVDIPLLVKTCEKLDQRDVGYEIFFTLLTITTFILAAASSSQGSEVLISASILLLVAAAGVTWIIKEKKQRQWVKELFVSNGFDQERFKKEFLGNIALSKDNESGGRNIVIYDGFNPFVGAGIDLDGWSISIDLTKKKDDVLAEDKKQTENYELDELYSLLRKNLKDLGFSNFTIKDLLFVNGTDVKDVDWILPDKYKRPLSFVDDKDIKKYYAANNKVVRHYNVVQVADWENDIILSFYIRFSLQKNNLFVEVSRFLLTPIASEYRKIDKLATRSKSTRIRDALIKFVFGGLYSAYLTLKFASRIQTGLVKMFDNKQRREKKEIDENPLFNYGAKTSLREQFSGGEYMHYFQKLDKELYFKTLERSFLDTVVAFLDEHNIETSDIVERRTTIINSGIIVKGGDVNAASLAVGKKAKAMTQK